MEHGGLWQWQMRALSSIFSLFSLVLYGMTMLPCYRNASCTAVERSRMLLMLIGSFSQQAPPCAPANNKRSRCLLRLINQTNATGGTKHVCKCTWAFLTCLPVYMAGGSGGFMHLCVCDWGQTGCMDATSEWPEWTLRLNSAFHTSCAATRRMCGSSMESPVMRLWLVSFDCFVSSLSASGSRSDAVRVEQPSNLLQAFNWFDIWWLWGLQQVIHIIFYTRQTKLVTPRALCGSISDVSWLI